MVPFNGTILWHVCTGLQNYYTLNDHLLYKQPDEHKQILMSTYKCCLFIIIPILFIFGQIMQLTIRYSAE